MLSACAGRNVATGDTDYPQQNPTPAHLVTIAGAVPKELDISFKAVWSATNESCQYDVSGGAAKIYYSMRTDLEFSRSGSRFTLPVPIDKYVPGRCAWTLSVIQLFVTHGVGYPSQVDVYYSNHDRTSARSMDIWCSKSRGVSANGKDWGRCSKSKPGQRQHQPVPSSLIVRKYDRSPLELNIHYVE